MYCSICGRKTNHTTFETLYLGQVCADCFFKITGKPAFGDAHTELRTKDGIILWIRFEGENPPKIVAAWIDEGNIAVFNAVKNKTPELAISMLRAAIQHKTTFCSTCGKSLKKDEIAGVRFAGVFCERCWEEYKKQNSTICSICGKPLYECYC